MKKNLRKIPTQILVKLKTIKSDEIVVGCAVKFKADTLESGLLKHLGIKFTPLKLQVPNNLIPPITQGKFSAQNLYGVEIVRNHLPKETDYHAAEAPNWGDSSYGYHTVYLPHQKYPREFKPPRELEILMKCIDSRPDLSEYLIAFKVDEVLNRKSEDFNERLFEDLNLLQENVGKCGVEPAETALADYLKSLHVSWDILPPGNREDAIARLFQGRSPSLQEKDVAGKRYDFFMRLMPKQLVFGSSGFRRYFGALLEDDLVVFENIQYGNAVYVLFDNWEELSKRSRIELLSGKYGTNFERIIHHRGWKGEVQKIIAKKRNERKNKHGE